MLLDHRCKISIQNKFQNIWKRLAAQFYLQNLQSFFDASKVAAREQ